MQGKNTKDDHLPPVFAKAIYDDLYEGRIKLDPIEEVEQSKLPSPHMSAPILPPIRPRPASFKIKDQPTSNTLAAISHNLTNLRFVYILKSVSFNFVLRKSFLQKFEAYFPI